MMDPFQYNMATQFGRFRILFRKSFIENVYINILKNIFFCNSFYLIIFLKHLRCFFTNAYGVRICSACGGNSRRHFGRTMCLHTKDTSTGQPTAGRSKLPSAAGVFRKKKNICVKSIYLCILPYALADILGRVAHRLLVSDRKRRVIVQRFKSIKVKNKNR